MKSFYLYILIFFKCCDCNFQVGPDPWDYERNEKSQLLSSEFDTPSDLRAVTKNDIYRENKPGMGEWFYKRILAIVLKGGKIQVNEDETIHVSLQMNFDQERWNLLNEYIATNKLFTENMFRRSVGYIEDSICKPNIAEKIAMAWTEYIQFYLTKYQMQLTWILTIITMKVTLIWLWRYISPKHISILLFLVLYLYEGFVSYKEAEQQEVERFLSAVNNCKWYIWSSGCEVPPPDPLIFLKHMNPLKIGIRMFAILISEPLIIISETIKTICHGITDGLWYPFDGIMYGFLIVIFIGLLIFLLIMILFNYVLNIPFNLNFLGLISLCLKQRNRSFINKENYQSARVDTSDRISGATLNRILDVCSRALSTAEVKQSGNNKLPLITTRTTSSTLRRSASTGRLTSLKNKLYVNNTILALENNLDKHKIKRHLNGGGDAW